MLFCSFAVAQEPIISILTDNITAPQVSYSGIKGAGLRNPSNSLISSWDSNGTSFSIRYNVPATANILRMTQFTVSSFGSSAITMPVLDATVKIRRLSNPDVGDDRNYFNFWAKYSSTPAAGATTGTFKFTAPEVLNPEDAFALNNLTSGYDNIFQNTIANPHFGNIERVDFIIPAGLECYNNTDREQSGVAVIDRGTGDPFKIAAITALDASDNPSAFGNLVSVDASDFGGNLLGSSINYTILINDVKYKAEGRPSTKSSQNLRGVYISLADLGLAIGQRFYGYALFGPDVITADPDWTTYPNNSSSGSQLDPVNIMGLYKSPGSLLPLPIDFTVIRVNESAHVDFTLFNEFKGQYLVIQQSSDGTNFRDLDKLYVHNPGKYTFIDRTPDNGTNYYRIKMVDEQGASSISELKAVKFETRETIKIFPNPVIDQLNISFPVSWTDEPATVEIFTTAGQLLYCTVIGNPGTRESLSLTNLKAGSYIVRLTNRKHSTGYSLNFTVM